MSAVTTGEAEQRHSLRNGFDGCFVISPVSMTLLVTVVCGSPPANLAPAQGCQDHTTWPPAAASIERREMRQMRQRPSHPAPRVVTIARNAPLRGDGTRGTMPLIWGGRQGKFL
jgi:hypothetical protein